MGAVTLTPPARERRGGRRRWFDWHSWIGVLSGLLLFMVCWSGTFATLSHEIDWLLNPDQRVQPQGDPATLEEVYATVAAAYPDGHIEAVLPPLYRRFAADVVLLAADGQRRHVYVDPYRLVVTGDAPYLNVQRYLRDYHRRFFLGVPGLYIVCLMSLPLLGSLVTSLVFYRHWWKKFFTLRPGRNLRGWISNLHQWLGLWTLWFVLVIGVTGAWYLWEAFRAQVLGGPFSYVDAAASAVHPLPSLAIPENERLPFSELLQRARLARPDLSVGTVYPDREGYFYVAGQAGDLLVRHRANKLFIDPGTGDIVYDQRASDLSPYWRWSDTADPLHFGDFGGLVSKLVWSAFGLVLSFLSLSGVWLFARRLARNRRYHGKMRVTYAVALGSGILVALAAPLPLAALLPFLANGPASAALLPGVTAFILGWIAVTWALTLSWLAVLRRPLTASSRTQAGALPGELSAGSR